MGAFMEGPVVFADGRRGVASWAGVSVHTDALEEVVGSVGGWRAFSELTTRIRSSVGCANVDRWTTTSAAEPSVGTSTGVTVWSGGAIGTSSAVKTRIVITRSGSSDLASRSGEWNISSEWGNCCRAVTSKRRINSINTYSVIETRSGITRWCVLAVFSPIRPSYSSRSSTITPSRINKSSNSM